MLDHFRGDIYNSYQTVRNDETEVLIISLQDDLGRKLYARLFPHNKKAPTTGAAICFETVEFFVQVIKALSKRNFEPIPGHFGVGVYHGGGMSVFRLPSPILNDGQNKIISRKSFVHGDRR